MAADVTGIATRNDGVNHAARVSRTHEWPRRQGVTLIELLVVIGVLGLLAALILPAVFRARESSRRLECRNRLKQIGVAAHSHLAVNQFIPPPMPARSYQAGKLWSSAEVISGYYELLPYLEARAVYNSINAGGRGTSRPAGFAASDPVNMTAYRSRLNHFVCPSDSKDAEVLYCADSYRFNVGSSNPSVVTVTASVGAFQPTKGARAADFRDGLSATVGFSERSLGSQSESRFERRRDLWGAGILGLASISNDDQVLDVCRNLTGSPSAFVTNLGMTWMKGDSVYTWYNHVAPPNDRAPDCEVGDVYSSELSFCNFCSLAARSWHDSGVNCLTMDGAVHFVRDGVNLSVWRAIATRSGSETVEMSW